MPLAYSLYDDVAVAPRGDDLVLTCPRGEWVLDGLSPAARDAVLRIADEPATEDDLDQLVTRGDGVDALSRFYFWLSQLSSYRWVRLHAGEPGTEARRLGTLEAVSPWFERKRISIQPGTQYRLSRFAYMHRGYDGALALESPTSHARVRLTSAEAAALVHAAADGGCPEAMATRSSLGESDTVQFLELLAAGNFVGDLDDDGRLEEDRDATLQQWEFHDLLFHARSRMGRHDGAVGGRFRFMGKLPPQPAVKTAPPHLALFRLPAPDLGAIRLSEPGLEAVMDARASIRHLNGPPLTIDELGAFLYRVARVKSRYSVEDKGEFTTRPYPSGGASYETEFYVTIDACGGLPRGFYWYDPVNHALALLRYADRDTQMLLADAHVATARLAWPKVLITLAARFQRVAWKYDGMAYATILKNTGVLYSTMYLVATAMGLGPCGLGLGDSDRFARLAGTNYYQESSVGEFALTGGSGRTC